MKEIREERIIVVPKLSKLELDMKIFGLNEKQVIEKYRDEGIDIFRIVSSHERQVMGRAKLLEMIPKSRLMMRDYLTIDKTEEADAVIAFGGDNSATFIAHYMVNTPVIAINSDPKKSEGALTTFHIDDFQKFLPDLFSGNYNVESWTRLEASLNGKKLEKRALSEIFLGENGRKDMSRYILRVNGKEEEHKNSGLLVATGSGSTGWYDSANRYLFESGNIFGKDENKIAFLAMEPYRGKLNGSSLLQGYINQGESIEIDSLNDSNGILSIDCHDDFKFNRGDKAVIGISEKPLKVIIQGRK